MIPPVLFFLKIVSAIQGVPWSHANFRLILVLWICHWNVDRYCFESIDCFRYSGYFNDINYSYLWTWNIFPICVFSNFFHQYLYNFQCIAFTSFVKFIPRYFILFDAIINGIVFLISISDSFLLVYRSTRYFYIFIFVFCGLTEFVY